MTPHSLSILWRILEGDLRSAESARSREDETPLFRRFCWPSLMIERCWKLYHLLEVLIGAVDVAVALKLAGLLVPALRIGCPWPGSQLRGSPAGVIPWV